MNLNNLTIVILTYNEAPNIARTLSALRWVNQVVVVDSFSTDGTLDIISQFKNARIFQRKFDDHINQWNYGLAQVNTEWVFSLDADYLIPESLHKEIESLSTATEINGYYIPFKYCVFGKPLRGTILPPRLALFRRTKARYVEDGHTQLLALRGKAGKLKTPIWHDDRKSLSRWLWAQDRYMLIEVEKLTATPVEELSLGDKVRRQVVLAPFAIFFYCLILKGGILDGWRGWYYAFQRVFAELLLSLRLVEKKFNES